MPRRINILTTSHKHIRIHMCVEYIYIYIIYIYYTTSVSRVPFRLSGPTLTTAHHSETPRPKDFSTQQSMRFNAWKMWDRFNHWRCISESHGLSIWSPRFSHFLWNKAIFSSSSIVSGFALFFHCELTSWLISLWGYSGFWIHHQMLHEFGMLFIIHGWGERVGCEKRLP